MFYTHPCNIELCPILWSSVLAYEFRLSPFYMQGNELTLFFSKKVLVQLYRVLHWTLAISSLKSLLSMWSTSFFELGSFRLHCRFRAYNQKLACRLTIALSLYRCGHRHWPGWGAPRLQCPSGLQYTASLRAQLQRRSSDTSTDILGGHLYRGQVFECTQKYVHDHSTTVWYSLISF